MMKLTDNIFTHGFSEAVVKKLNLFILFVVAIPVIGVVVVQLVLSELPCPLLLLQRVAFFGIALGLLLNLRYGVSPTHYAIALLSAMFGILFSLNQVLSHVVPGMTQGFGSPVFGLHLYTWSLVFYAVVIFLIALAMLVTDWNSCLGEAQMSKLEDRVYIAYTAVLVLNVILLFLECGLSNCPGNPTGYIML